jgi:hypothetical protein
VQEVDAPLTRHGPGRQIGLKPRSHGLSVQYHRRQPGAGHDAHLLSDQLVSLVVVEP